MAIEHLFTPTRTRYTVLAFACALSAITYLDRVCFGAAAPMVATELGLASVADLRGAFTAFAIAYSLFEIPSGWLGDRLGARAALLRIVAWWSLCTALTGCVGLRLGGIVAGGLGTLVVLRFLFGAGEAGAYPNITRALYDWFPPQEWARAQGAVWMSGRLMGGFTPLVWDLLVHGFAGAPAVFTWRAAFVLFGAIGLVWCGLFAARFVNHPDEHPAVNRAERDWIGSRARSSGHALSWRALLASGNLWILCLMYFCVNYGWYFNITYLTSFLRDRYQLPDGSVLGSVYKGGPLWVGAAGCLAGGWLADLLARRWGDRGKARRTLAAVALAACSACWLVARAAPTAETFFLGVSLAAFLNDLVLASAWATCQDIGGRHAAVTAAWMNTIGTLGAAAAGWITGWQIEWAVLSRAGDLGVPTVALSSADRLTALLAGYDAVFVSYAAVYLVAAACWLWLQPTKPIESRPESV